MPKLSKADIEISTEEWGKLQVKIAKLEEQRAAETAVFQKKYDVGVAAINEHYDPKISKLQERSNELESTIRGWLGSRKSNTKIEAGKAIGEVEHSTSLGARVINVQKFLGYVKEKGDAIYECITVGVKKAEDLLGKEELDKISTRPTTPAKTVTLRLKD